MRRELLARLLPLGAPAMSRFKFNRRALAMPPGVADTGGAVAASGDPRRKGVQNA